MEAGVLLAAETRGGRDEVLHPGHAVLLDADGSVSRHWGEPATATYWRSSAKPVQAVPFARIHEKRGLSAVHLAVACGSHAGEASHVAAVREILAGAGLGETHLRCGSHAPWSAQSDFTRKTAQSIHNNCSGKHAAMLAVCVARGWDTGSYLSAQHPLQRELVDLVETLGGERPHLGVDGCGLPTFHASLLALAHSMQGLTKDAAGRSVVDAMARRPDMVSGTGQFCTQLGLATEGNVVGKYGALGCYVALHRPSGAAFALKLTSGDEKACKAVVAYLLHQVGWLDDPAVDQLTSVRRDVRNHAGTVVGALEMRI